MRKYHNKTRTGCVQCKKRRIKCDETKPSCLNCSRRAVDCSLTFLTPAAPRSQYQFQYRERVTAVTNNNALNGARVLSDTSKTPNLELSPANVELFQHYTSNAHRALSNKSRGPELWEFTVPKLAIQFPFLMHGMLALSAFHLATLQPERRRELVTTASWNEFQALPSYRAIMTNPNQENVHAIFVFSGFVAQYSLATSHFLEDVNVKPRIENETVDDLPEFPPNWFHIIRGTSTMIYRYYMLLAQGPFRQVLALHPDDVPFEKNPDDIYMRPLEDLFFPAVYTPSHRSSERDSSSSASPEAEQSAPVDKEQAKRDAELQVYAKTLYSLRRTSALRFSPSGTIDDLSASYLWPGIVDNAYIRLLTDRKPEALVIFAHYCVFLGNCSNSSWYLHGIGKRLVAAIWRSLPLQWRPWVSWPVAATGAIVGDDDGFGYGVGGDNWTGAGVFGGRVEAWVDE